MKRPNKKDYDFNDHFNCVKYAIDLGKYVDHLEQREIKQELKSTTIEISAHKFEVYHKDVDLKLDHYDAIESCKELGDGWRLPTRKELLEMYDHKEELVLKDDVYWSSTEYGTSDAFGFGFNDGHADYYGKFNTLSVRAVRTIK